MSYLSIYTYNEADGLLEFEDLKILDSIPEDTRIWLDIESEDPELMAQVAERFSLHELSVEDCLDPGHFPKIEEYGTYFFILFRGLKQLFSGEAEETDTDDDEDAYTRKVAIFLSEDFIITYRRKEVPWLDAIVRQVKQFPEYTLGTSTNALTHRILDVLVDRFLRGLNYFEKIIDDYEDQAVEHYEDFELSEVLELKRELSAMRVMSREQRAIIARLASEPTLIREKQQRRYFKDIDDHAVAILKVLDKLIESVVGIRDTYFAIANVRLGDTMRILAVITTIAVPLHIVVGLYGMNFEAIPLLHNPYGFWVVVFVMIFLALLLLIYFRKRRWI